MLANFAGVDFLRTALKFRERKRDSLSLVYVLHKTCNEAFSRRSRARTVKKCTKKSVMHVQKMRSLYFCGKYKIEGKTQLNFFFTMEPIARKLCMKLP